MFLNLIPTAKIAPKGPKKVRKRPKMWPNLKQKVRAIPPKPKLMVYIGRSQKNFRTWPQPEKKPFHFSILNFQIPNFQISNFWIPNFRIFEFRIFEFRILNSEFSNSKFSKIFKFQMFKCWNVECSNSLFSIQIHNHVDTGQAHDLSIT